MKKTFFAIAIAAWTALVVVGVQLLLGLILSQILPKEALASTILNVAFSVISGLIALALIIFVPSLIFKNKITKPARDSLGLRGLPTWTDLGLAPIGYVVSIVVATGITALFRLLPWFNASEAQNLGLDYYMTGAERGVAFVGLAIVAPIIEELIFRGWLYGRLRVKIPKWIAILVVSLVFALVHFQWNVGISVFCMSVVNCLMREVTGTIYAGTLVHVINNSVAFFLVYVLNIA